MTCVTLKRPLEVLGSPHMMDHEPVAKKRCGMSLFPTTPPGRVGQHDIQASERISSAPVSHRHGLCGSPVSFRSNKRAKRKLDVDQYSVPSTPTRTSPFESATPPLDETGKLAAHLERKVEMELKRIHRRKSAVCDDLSVDNQPTSSIPVNSLASSNVKDQPLFTLKQVTIVCKRMIKEREALVRSEYDKVLTTKLAEQYDTFVKFSHDQIERRLASSTFSYVS